MSRARLILNPAAGTDQALAYAQVLSQRLRGRFGPVEVVLTTGPGDAEAAAARAVRDDCDVLFVGGGDGTLNEALNGVAAEPDGLDRVTFGVIPLGTGNDFARALGLPLDAEAALAALLAGHSVGVDVGVLNGRRFVNVSAGGFLAAVSEAVTPELKSLAGRLAYLLGGAQALVEFEPVRATMLAEPGGIRLGAGIYAFAACNAPLIGGGSLIAPHARIDDGLLDFCVIETMSAVQFLALLRRVADGEHVGDSRVRYVQGTRATFQFDRPVLVNTDGEVLEAETCEYSLLPKAGRFLRTD